VLGLLFVKLNNVIYFLYFAFIIKNLLFMPIALFALYAKDLLFMLFMPITFVGSFWLFLCSL